jgi:hypothetical protein
VLPKEKIKKPNPPSPYEIFARKLLKIFLVLCLLGLLAFTGLFYEFVKGEDGRNRRILAYRQEWVRGEESNLRKVFQEAFPLNEACRKNTNNCEAVVRQYIDAELDATLKGGEVYGRLPIYFVRLKDGQTLETLFQSGKYIEEHIDRKTEKEVAEMLQGKRDTAEFPQVNCCGGDDILPSVPILGWMLPSRTYLGYLPTEIEHILLVKDEDGRILGAVFYLYGD